MTYSKSSAADMYFWFLLRRTGAELPRSTLGSMDTKNMLFRVTEELMIRYIYSQQLRAAHGHDCRDVAFSRKS